MQRTRTLAGFRMYDFYRRRFTVEKQHCGNGKQCKNCQKGVNGLYMKGWFESHVSIKSAVL